MSQGSSARSTLDSTACATEQRRATVSLTLEESKRVIEAATGHAEGLGIKVCVSVCDAGGRLVALNKMDGAMWAAVYGSQGKATSSAGFGALSGALQEKADEPVYRGIAEAAGGMILHQGAVPIVRDGAVIGACGVGGGTGAQDEECAAAGAAAI